MEAKKFPEVNLIIAEHQDEYENLPVFHDKEKGTVVMCFQLSPEEWKKVSEDGEFYLKMYIGNGSINPIGFSCLKEDLL